MKHRAIYLPMLAALVTMTGCDQMASVSGNVRYKGENVESGVVQYIPPDGTPVAAEITEGHYEIAAERGLEPGSFNVKLFGYRETGRMLVSTEDPSKKEPEVVELLPRKYNQASEIVVELSQGMNAKNFELD